LSILFTFEVNQNRVAEVSRVVGSPGFKGFVKSAVEALPEYGAAREVAEKFGESTAIRYILFVAVNDWGLANVYYRGRPYRGAEALWYATRDVLFELGRFDADELTQRVLDKLSGVSGERRELFKRVSAVVGSDEVSAIIDGWIRRRVVDEASLRSVLERAQSAAGRRLPADKIVNLVARTVSYVLGPRGFRVEARPSVLFDVHVAKVTLRLGLVKAEPRSSGRYLPVGFPLTGSRELRQKTVEAWNEVSKASGIPTWDIDAALWHIGRNFCLFDDEQPQQASNIHLGVQVETSCPIRRLGKEPGCPFREVCESYRGDIGLRILSQRATGRSEVVLFVEKLRKLL